MRFRCRGTNCHGAWGIPWTRGPSRHSCDTERWPCCEARCTPLPCGPLDHSCGSPLGRPWDSPSRSDPLQSSKYAVKNNVEDGALTLLALATLDVGSRARLLAVSSLVTALAAILAGELVNARDGACNSQHGSPLCGKDNGTHSRGYDDPPHRS